MVIPGGFILVMDEALPEIEALNIREIVFGSSRICVIFSFTDTVG